MLGVRVHRPARRERSCPRAGETATAHYFPHEATRPEEHRARLAADDPLVPPGCLIKRHCAMAESFFAALKNECVYRTQYPTREHARRDVVRYIEFWCNSRRRHSGLQYRTPQQVHDEYLEQQSAA